MHGRTHCCVGHRPFIGDGVQLRVLHTNGGPDDVRADGVARADARADGVARADLAGTDAAAISSSDAQSVSSMDSGLYRG